MIQEELKQRGIDLPSHLQAVKDEGSAAVMLLSPHAAVLKQYFKYRDDPLGFVKNVLKGYLWSKQVEVLEALRDNDAVTVRACHGVGKTYVAACAVLWFFMTRPNAVVVTTAPTARQVEELLWREIRELHKNNNLPGKCLTTELEISPRWFALGLSTDNSDRFQGFHSSSGELLAVVDEAAGVPKLIYDAVDGITTNDAAKILLIGNPTSNEGVFYDSHHDALDNYKAIHISALTSPNFTEEGESLPPYIRRVLVGKKWVDKKAIEWGVESPDYFARVLGEFPTHAEDALISSAWISLLKDHEPFVDEKRDKFEFGVDVARQGGCESVCVVRRGNRILEVDAWKSGDLTVTAARVAAHINKYAGGLNGVRSISAIRVDATGMGASIVDMLKRDMPHLRNKVKPVFVGNTPSDTSRFNMLRDEIWWNLRDAIRQGEIGPINDPILVQQLQAIKFEYTANGKIKVEDKKSLLKRGSKSPDRADALGLAMMRGKSGNHAKVYGL